MIRARFAMGAVMLLLVAGSDAYAQRQFEIYYTSRLFVPGRYAIALVRKDSTWIGVGITRASKTSGQVVLLDKGALDQSALHSGLLSHAITDSIRRDLSAILAVLIRTGRNTDGLTDTVYAITYHRADGSNRPYTLRVHYGPGGSFITYNQHLVVMAPGQDSPPEYESVIQDIGLSDEVVADLEEDILEEAAAYALKDDRRRALEAITSGHGEALGSIELVGRTVDVFAQKRAEWLTNLLLNGAVRARTPISDVRVGVLHVTNASIGFIDGAAADVIVRGTFEGDSGRTVFPISFQNAAPIPCRTRDQIHDFNGAATIGLFGDQSTAARSLAPGGIAIALADVIHYDRSPIASGSYVPPNRSFELDTSDGSRTVLLRHRALVDDVELRFFGDLAGLERDNPFGILQFDARYPVVSNARPIGFFPVVWVPAIGGAAYYYVRAHGTHGSPIPLVALLGTLVGAYFEPLIPLARLVPFVTISRLENRGGMPLGTTRDDSGRTTSYLASAYDLYRYANLRIGLDVNIATIRLPYLNSVLSWNAGWAIVKSPADSTVTTEAGAVHTEETDLLSWSVAPEIVWESTFSDHVRFAVSYSAIYFSVLQGTIGAARTPLVLTDVPSPINRVETRFDIFPNAQSRESAIFFRAALIERELRTNMSLQIGYETSLSRLLSF